MKIGPYVFVRPYKALWSALWFGVALTNWGWWAAFVVLLATIDKAE